MIQSQNLTIELMIRILCDIEPEKVDLIYVFAQTRDNENSLLNTAAELASKNKLATILICDGTTEHGYPGFEWWASKLRDRRVGHITPLALTVPVNTLTEASALTKFAIVNNKKNVLIVSPPFHQPRAFMTTVSVVKRLGADLNIYNHPAKAEDWNQVVLHSQGTLRNTRKGLILNELERIDRYSRQGDIIPPEEIINYLNNRT